VFVVGGGPAGIAAALAARRNGLTATVADSCPPAIDKPCGEGLMPDALEALGNLGVTIPPLDAHRFRGIRFVNSGTSVQATFPSGFGLGVRRTQLHRIMVEHAEREGVRFLWHAPVTGLYADGVLVQGQLHAARWIVGADGGSSRVRRWAGLDVHRHEHRRFAFRRHYRVAKWPEVMELHWGGGCQLYVTPVGSSDVCVALVSRDPSLRLDQALLEFPEMAGRLQGAEHSSPERGAVSVTRKLARVCNARVALVGDASGGVDAVTGDGLCLAFRHAALLGRCMAGGSLAGYQSAHRTLGRQPELMSKLMLLLDQRSWLRDRVIRALASEPKIFARLLATHVGAVSPLDLTTNGLALGWKFVTL
jgi:menaquinone-9 beta-reductase